MAEWFLSPALAQLRTQINELYPNRSKDSDGSIGDAAHSARKSDHNPDWDSNGIVRAIDVTAKGVDRARLIAAIIRDKRTRYVISEGKIWQVVDPVWRTYTGANKHDRHFHISIRDVNGYDMDKGKWDLGKDDDMALSDKDIERIAEAVGKKVWSWPIAPPSNLKLELGPMTSMLKFIRALGFRAENLYRRKP